ncbi:DUF4376 domain-containing protein [Alcaligenaceae bacterium]|nr:DUF4376 domain-containing protein [Alcaligenaceae bacterium]
MTDTATVYLFDEQRIYMHALEVDAYGPIRARSTLTVPPETTGTEVAQWTGSDWVVLPERPVPPAPPEPSIEDLRAQVQQAATDKRWQVMTGGLTLPGGIEVGTTIDDQNRITSVVANAALAGLADADEVDFKATNGWVRITIAQIKAIAGAIGQFVQACYSAERAHHEAIALLETPEEIHDYDVNSGWPQSESAET